MNSSCRILQSNGNSPDVLSFVRSFFSLTERDDDSQVERRQRVQTVWKATLLPMPEHGGMDGAKYNKILSIVALSRKRSNVTNPAAIERERKRNLIKKRGKKTRKRMSAVFGPEK